MKISARNPSKLCTRCVSMCDHESVFRLHKAAMQYSSALLCALYVLTPFSKCSPLKRREHLPPLEYIWVWRPWCRHVTSACLSVHSECQNPSDGNKLLPFRKTQHTHLPPAHVECARSMSEQIVEEHIDTDFNPCSKPCHLSI